LENSDEKKFLFVTSSRDKSLKVSQLLFNSALISCNFNSVSHFENAHSGKQNIFKKINNKDYLNLKLNKFIKRSCLGSVRIVGSSLGVKWF